MFGNSHLDRIRQTFEDQFSTDRQGCIYRKSQKGMPIRVTVAERDSYVATFNKRLRYAMWSIYPATVVLIVTLVWLVPDIDSATGTVALWLGLAAILLPFLTAFYWLWNAPARDLQARAPEGATLPKEEARALVLSKVSYGQLGLTALMGLGLIWQKFREGDLLQGGGLAWFLLGGLLVVLAGVQAIRKWRSS